MRWYSNRGRASYGTALQNALLDQMVEPLGEHLARDAEIGLDLVEAIHPDPNVAHDQRRPRLTDDVQGARDRARHRTELRPLHPPMIANGVPLRNSDCYVQSLLKELRKDR